MDGPFMVYAPMVILGMVLGAVFFGGLWVTVQRLPRAKRPGLLMLTSVMLRTAIVLGSIWYFSGGDAASIVACLAGFVGFRLLATHGSGLWRRNGAS